MRLDGVPERLISRQRVSASCNFRMIYTHVRRFSRRDFIKRLLPPLQGSGYSDTILDQILGSTPAVLLRSPWINYG